jgi:hypothetical protein
VPTTRIVLRVRSASAESRSRKLWQGKPVAVAFGLRLALGLGGAGGPGRGVWLGGGVFVVEEQLGPGLAQVPLEVVGEHAEQDVGAHAVLEPVVDRAGQEVEALSVRKARSTSLSCL